jgi:hypothetical protein
MTGGLVFKLEFQIRDHIVNQTFSFDCVLFVNYIRELQHKMHFSLLVSHLPSNIATVVSESVLI